MSRGADSQAGIQQLLQAEQQAQAIVAKAKQDKNALLKRAREEADKEIANIRAAREAQFQDYVKSVRPAPINIGLIVRSILAAKVQQLVGAKQEEVIKLLLNAVGDVYTETVTTTAGQKVLA